jgi:hypothetical protein
MVCITRAQGVKKGRLVTTAFTDARPAKRGSATFTAGLHQGYDLLLAIIAPALSKLVTATAVGRKNPIYGNPE